MKKKFQKALIATLAVSATFLGACTKNTKTTTGDNTSGETTATAQTTGGETTTATSSSEEPEQYTIKIVQAAGLTVTANKTKALEGETITLTVSVKTGYILDKLYKDTEELTVTNGTASFTMPADDVKIHATMSVDGDMSIDGEVAAPLAKEGNIYVARNIPVSATSKFYFKVKVGENSTRLGYSYLNLYKSFANITSAFSSSSDTTVNLDGKDVMMSLGGNASYDFYYDPSDASYPLYVQRVAVTTAPTNSDMLYNLFDSSVYSESAVNPNDVKTVTFYDSISQNHYSYERYTDSSLATVTKEGNDTPYAYVYKSLDSDVLTVVDNYIEAVKTTDPYGISTYMYADTTAMDDTAKYSGKYLVSDSVEEDWQFNRQSYRAPTRNSEFFATSNSHSMHSIDMNQYASYRSSFTIEDDLKFANVDISSVTNADGSFTTTVKSYKTYDPDNSASTFKLMSAKTHIEYDVVMTFDKRGAILTGTYKEMKYGADAYDFTNNKFLTDGENMGTLVKRMSYAYTYGTPKEGKPTFDTSKYFASGISAVITNSLGTNKVTSGDYINNRADSENLVTVTPTNSTALDTWEWGVVASDNAAVYLPDGYLASNAKGWVSNPDYEGTVNLTVSNYAYPTQTPVTLAVTMVLGTYHSLFLNDYNNRYVTTADSCYVEMGNKIEITLDTSPDYNRSLAGVTIAYSTEGVITASIDVARRKLVINALAASVTADTVIKLTLNSSHYQSGWGPSVISVTVQPGTPSLINAAYLVGTWQGTGVDETTKKQDDSTLVFTKDTMQNALGETLYKGTVNVDGDVFSFAYLYNDATYSWSTFYYLSHTGTTYVYNDYELFFDIDYKTNMIGVCLVGYTTETSSSDGTTTIKSATAIFGSATAGVNEYNVVEIEATAYYDFAKVSA